ETRTPRGEEVPRGGIRLLRRSEGLALARPRRRNPGSVEQSALIAAAVSVRTSGGADFGADRCRQGGGRVRLRSVGTSGGRGIFADPPAAVVAVEVLVQHDLEAGGVALLGDDRRPGQEEVPDAEPALAVGRDHRVL